MMKARADELMMNFICCNQYIMAGTDRGHLQQFCFCPDASCRIVWTAKQEEADLMILYFPLEIIKINRIVSIFQNERAVDEFAAIIADRFGKRIVDRLLDKDCLARFCEGPDCHTERKYDARSED